MPRANRGLFVINELPDLAGKVQVGLFNIMQEGDVQIKGYPVRLPLDVMLVFTANPEDYTARGKIITPSKRPHRQRNPHALSPDCFTGHGHHPARGLDRRRRPWRWKFRPTSTKWWSISRSLARDDKRIDKRSGVSQRLPITVLENVVSNAERRRAEMGERAARFREFWIFTRRCLPSQANWNWNTKAS